MLAQSQFQYFDDIAETMAPYVKAKFGRITPQQMTSQQGDKGFMLHHWASKYWIDYYSHVPKNDTDCRAPIGRNQTKFWHDGFWVSGMHNPAIYAKRYGNEFLKHVPWQQAKNEEEYKTTKLEFPA